MQRGTIQVGELADVGFERWLFRDYRVLDQAGREVLLVPEMEANWDASALLTEGKLVFRRAWFRNARIQLLKDEEGGQISLASALEVPKGKLWIPIEMKDVRLENNVFQLDLPGKPAMKLTNVHGLADLHMAEEFRWRMDRLKGTIESSVIDIGFRNMRGRLKTDNPRPLLVDLDIDVAIAEPHIRIEYHLPSVDGKSGKPRLDFDLPNL